MLDRIWITIITLIILLIVALIFEDSRDWLVEAWEYVISFEWFEDLKDVIASAFEDIGEFSIYGLVFAFIFLGVSYSTRYINMGAKGMGLIESMTQYMSPTQRIFWTIASYVGTAIIGYFMGKFYENTG